MIRARREELRYRVIVAAAVLTSCTRVGRAVTERSITHCDASRPAASCSSATVLRKRTDSGNGRDVVPPGGGRRSARPAQSSADSVSKTTGIRDGAAAHRRGGWSVVVLQQGPSSLPDRRSHSASGRTVSIPHSGERRRTALYMVWPESNRRDHSMRGDAYARRGSVAGMLLSGARPGAEPGAAIPRCPCTGLTDSSDAYGDLPGGARHLSTDHRRSPVGLPHGQMSEARALLLQEALQEANARSVDANHIHSFPTGSRRSPPVCSEYFGYRQSGRVRDAARGGRLCPDQSLSVLADRFRVSVLRERRSACDSGSGAPHSAGAAPPDLRRASGLVIRGRPGSSCGR